MKKLLLLLFLLFPAQLFAQMQTTLGFSNFYTFFGPPGDQDWINVDKFDKHDGAFASCPGMKSGWISYYAESDNSGVAQIPDDAIIDLITLRVYAQASTTSSITPNEIYVGSIAASYSANMADGIYWDTTETAYDYPDIGNAAKITVDILKNNQVSAIISVRNDGGGGDTGEVDNIDMIIDYHLPPLKKRLLGVGR